VELSAGASMIVVDRGYTRTLKDLMERG